MRLPTNARMCPDPQGPSAEKQPKVGETELQDKPTTPEKIQIDL